MSSTKKRKLVAPPSLSQSKKVSKKEAEAGGGFDLIAMLDEKSKNSLNMKELPAANRKGQINYYGYMDDYFNGKPPVASRNWVIDNFSLQIVRDLTGCA